MTDILTPVQMVKEKRTFKKAATHSDKLRLIAKVFNADYADLRRVIMPATATAKLARLYQGLPMYDEAAETCFKALREEVKEQFDFLTGACGIEVNVVKTDPYTNVSQIIDEIDQTGSFKVWSTEACGNPHPYLTDDENDMLRAVHDAFGHAASESGFDANGEERAWRVQSRMFSKPAMMALATELRGQGAYAIAHGDFGLQKVALLPWQWTTTSLPDSYEAQAVR